MKPTRLDAYRLMHEGALALAEMEHNGIRVDMDHLNRAKKEIADEQRDLKIKLQQDEVYKLQRKRYGQKTNINSPIQLATVLTKDLGYELPTTDNNRLKTDQNALINLDLPYCQTLIAYKQLDKADDYLNGIMREVVDGFVHTSLNLHLATSYRSSDDSPNLQNQPTRLEKVARMIRSALIPRNSEYIFIERDYSALEFKVNACQWKDPTMVEYASDPDKDIHRDCAVELFRVSKEDVNQKSRYCAKNMFVFPEIYGDFYISCAEALWEAVIKHNLIAGKIDKKDGTAIEGGIPMFEHLKNRGITKLGECDTKKPSQPGTFELHVKEVEKKFYRWFPVLKENRDRFWAQYQRDGFFELMTGFVISGVNKRNFVLNAISQGPAFHALLWSLIQIVKWARKKKTKIVLEIHDCILADVHKSELDEYLEVSEDIMTRQVRAHYDWIITPLEVETEICEENWFNKKKYIP